MIKKWPMSPLAKRQVLIGAAFSVLVITGLIFLWRKDSYDLNRSVRQVCLRILVYEELSLHRGSRFRFDFQKNGFKIFALHRGEKSEWREVSAITHAPSIETSPAGFRLDFVQGRAEASFLSEGRTISRFPLSLRFSSLRNPDRQKGIIFFEDGHWRPL